MAARSMKLIMITVYGAVHKHLSRLSADSGRSYCFKIYLNCIFFAAVRAKMLGERREAVSE